MPKTTNQKKKKTYSNLEVEILSQHMANQSIKMRTIIVLVLEWTYLYFFLKQTFWASIMIGVFCAIITLFVAKISRSASVKEYFDKITMRQPTGKSEKSRLKSTLSDSIIYAIDRVFGLLLMSISSYVIHKKPELLVSFQQATHSNIFWIAILLFVSIYNSFTLFIYKKTMSILYIVLCISVAFCGILAFSPDWFSFSEHETDMLKFYSVVVGAFLTMVAVLEYIEKKLTERNKSKEIEIWNTIVLFMSWDFLKNPKILKRTVKVKQDSMSLRRQ